MEALDDIDDFEIGRHGLMIRQGMKSGLLLPQVAIEWGGVKRRVP